MSINVHIRGQSNYYLITLQKNDTYVEVARTSTGQATIGRLLPGSSYRFRLYSVNTDGISGPKSQSIIVHTLLGRAVDTI